MADPRAALSAAADVLPLHTHVWIDGELLLNGCSLPHEAAR